MAGNDDLPDIIPLGPSQAPSQDYREVYDPDTGMTVRVPINGLASRRPARAGADANITGFGTALGDAFVRSWHGETQADLAGDLAAILSKRDQISKLQPLTPEETLELSRLSTASTTPVMPSGPYFNINTPAFQNQARLGELRARQNRDALLAQLNADLEAKVAELKGVNDLLAQHQGTTYGKAQFDKAQGLGASLSAVANNPLDVLSQLAAESSWGSAKAAGIGAAATAATAFTGGGTLLAGAAGLGATGLATGMDSYDGKLLEELIKKNPDVIKDPKGYVEAYKRNPSDYEKAYREAKNLAIKVGVAEGGATAAMGGVTKLIPGGKTLTGKIASELAGEVSEEVVTAQAVNAAEGKGLLSPADAFKAGVGAIAGVGTQGPVMAGVGKAGGAIADAFKPNMQVDAGTLTPMAPRPFSMMPQSGPSQMAVDLNTLTPTTPLQVGPQPQLFVNPSSLTPADTLPDVIPLGAPHVTPAADLPAAASSRDTQDPAAPAAPQAQAQPRANNPLQPPAQAQAPQTQQTQGRSGTAASDYRAPQQGRRIVMVDPKKVLDSAGQGDPGFDIRDPQNQLSNNRGPRLAQAGAFLGDQNNRGQLEASRVGLRPDGSVAIGDGRHRLLAAQQAGLSQVGVDVSDEEAAGMARFAPDQTQAQPAPQSGGVASAFQPAPAQGRAPLSLAPVNNTNVTNPQVGMPSARPMSVRDQAAWDALEKKGAELDRRRAERRAKFERDTNPATRRRGNEQIAQGLINGLRRGGNVSHKEATAALRLVERLMEHGYLDNAAVSVSEAERGGGVRGDYNATRELISLFVRNTERPGILRRTFTHEVAHHLERMIPAKDLEAARQQFLKDRAKWLKGKEGLAALLGQGNWLDRSFSNEQIKQFLATNKMNPALISQYFIRDTKNGLWRLKMTDETYQYTNFSEYLAEKVANLAVDRDDARFNPQSNAGIWAKIKDMLAQIKKGLLDVFSKDEVEAIWDRFQEGEYTSDFKRDKLHGYDNTGGQNPVMDDPRTADYRAPRYGDADQDRKERVDRIDKLEPNKVFSERDEDPAGGLQGYTDQELRQARKNVQPSSVTNYDVTIDATNKKGKREQSVIAVQADSVAEAKRRALATAEKGGLIVHKVAGVNQVSKFPMVGLKGEKPSVGTKVTQTPSTPEGWDRLHRSVDRAINYANTLPDLGLSENWSQVISLALPGGTGDLPPAPLRLHEWASDPAKFKAFFDSAMKENPDLISSAVEGLGSLAPVHEMAMQGKIPTRMVAMHFLWGVLSKQLTPFEQEAGWIKLTNNPKVLAAIEDSIAGRFNMDLDTWVGLVQESIKGPGLKAGNQSTSNSNAFHLTLRKWNGRWDELAGIINNRDLSGPQMRRQIYRAGLGAGSGFGYKVMSFNLLTLARRDMFIGDRWQFVNLWFPHLELTAGPDGVFYYNKSGVPEDRTRAYKSLNTLDKEASAEAVYALIENGMQKIADANRSWLEPILGHRPMASDIHWLSWNIIKKEPVGHSSLDSSTRALQEGIYERPDFPEAFPQVPKSTERYVGDGRYEVFGGNREALGYSERRSGEGDAGVRPAGPENDAGRGEAGPSRSADGRDGPEGVAQSARDDGENTPIPGGYREAFFKAKQGAGAPEPKQIKFWTDLGHDLDADPTKQFLWAIDKAGKMHIVSVSDLRDVLHEYGYENRDGQDSESDSLTGRDYSKKEGVTHLDWESLAHFGEMDDTPVEGVTYDLLKGPAHGRIDATGDVVRISMVQKGQSDAAMKADMRDYVKGKLSEVMGVEPNQARGYDFTDAGPFNGPEVFSARDEEGPQRLSLERAFPADDDDAGFVPFSNRAKSLLSKGYKISIRNKDKVRPNVAVSSPNGEFLAEISIAMKNRKDGKPSVSKPSKEFPNRGYTASIMAFASDLLSPRMSRISKEIEEKQTFEGVLENSRRLLNLARENVAKLDEVVIVETQEEADAKNRRSGLNGTLHKTPSEFEFYKEATLRQLEKAQDDWAKTPKTKAEFDKFQSARLAKRDADIAAARNGDHDAALVATFSEVIERLRQVGVTRINFDTLDHGMRTVDLIAATARINNMLDHSNAEGDIEGLSGYEPVPNIDNVKVNGNLFTALQVAARKSSPDAWIDGWTDTSDASFAIDPDTAYSARDEEPAQPPMSVEQRKARIEEIKREILPLASKGKLSREEGTRYSKLGMELETHRFEMRAGRGLKLELIKPMQERGSAIPSEIVKIASDELASSRAAFDALTEASLGVRINQDTAVDVIMNGENANVSPSDLYSAFDRTREALRRQFGDTIVLYRAHGKQKQKATQNWHSTEAGAREYGSNVERREIPVDDVIAMNVGLRGAYEEFVVGKKPGSVDQDTALSARDDDGENTVIPGGNREAFFNMKAGVPEPKRIKYYTDIGHPTEGQDKNKFFLWAIDGRGKLRVRSVAEVEQMLKETGKDPEAFMSNEDEAVHGDWFHHSDETGKDGYDLRDAETMGRIDASGDVIRISYATRGLEGEPAEIDVEARDNAKRLLADYLRKAPGEIRGYDYTRTMETGEDPTAFSARDEEPAGPEFTTPGGELTNHGDKSLAKGGFMTREALRIPENERSRYSFAFAPDERSGGYAAQIKYDGKPVANLDMTSEVYEEGKGLFSLDMIDVDPKFQGRGLSTILQAEVYELGKRANPPVDTAVATVLDPKARPLKSMQKLLGKKNVDILESTTEATDEHDQFGYEGSNDDLVEMAERDGVDFYERGQKFRDRREIQGNIPQYTPEQRQLINDIQAARAAGDMPKARQLKAQFDQSVQDNGTQILSARDDDGENTIIPGGKREKFLKNKPAPRPTYYTDIGHDPAKAKDSYMFMMTYDGLVLKRVSDLQDEVRKELSFNDKTGAYKMEGKSYGINIDELTHNDWEDMDDQFGRGDIKYEAPTAIAFGRIEVKDGKPYIALGSRGDESDSIVRDEGRKGFRAMIKDAVKTAIERGEITGVSRDITGFDYSFVDGGESGQPAVFSARDEDVPSTGSTARKAGLAAGALALAPTTVEAATGAAKAAGATIAGVAIGDLISVASGIAFTSSDRLLKGLNPIVANMHLLANDTRSKTMKRVAEMFNRLGGNTDAGAQETYHEERDANRRIFRNKLADAFEPLAKLSQDQIRALDITIARALAGEIPMPSGPVGQVVRNLQALSDELYTYLRQSGLELNYAQGYAIPHSFNAEAVAKDEQAFIDTAEQAYIDNNPKRIRSLQKYIQQVDQEAAQNGGFTQEMTDRKNAMLEEIKKLQTANPRQQAEDLAAAILSGAEGGDQSQGLILASNPRNQNRADFLKSRVFEHSARAMLREYFHNDPRHAWNNYIARATTLAEFSRRFGADGQTWNSMVEQMRKEGVKEVDITRIKEMVLDAMGALTPAAQGSHAMANALLGLSNMSKLKSTFITNFLEAQAQAIPGNLLDTITAPVVMLKEFAAILAELTPRQRALLKQFLRVDLNSETGNMELARITGLMDSAGVHNIMENSAYALDNKADFREDSRTDRAARKISNATGRMAQAYGIEASENAKRAMGARYAAGRLDQHVSEFLRDNILARALKKVGYKGDAMTTRNEAIMRLRRAGVNDANMIAFGTWWEKARASGKFNEMLADTTDSMAAMARKAIRMESARAMVNSNRAMKPGGERNKAISQDNFWGKAVMSFLNYPAAFREQIAKPMARDIASGFRGSESEGGQATFFSPAERARMIARASAIPAMAVSAAAFLALRVLALGDEEDKEELKKKTLLNHMIDGLSYTGLTGGKTEAVQRARRGQLPPIIDEGVRLGKNFEREATKSNGKERAITKSLTRSVAVPATQGVVSTYAPAPIAAVVDQALASKAFNELVVDTVAGKEKEKKKASSDPRTGSRESGRSSGRTDGR